MAPSRPVSWRVPSRCGPLETQASFGGVGKTMLAQNLAHRAILAGHTARFVSAADMLGDLAAQDGSANLRRRLRHYTTPSLLVLDEVGYMSYGQGYADLLFQVISQRYQRRHKRSMRAMMLVA